MKSVKEQEKLDQKRAQQRQLGVELELAKGLEDKEEPKNKRHEKKKKTKQVEENGVKKKPKKLSLKEHNTLLKSMKQMKNVKMGTFNDSTSYSKSTKFFSKLQASTEASNEKGRKRKKFSKKSGK